MDKLDYRKNLKVGNQTKKILKSSGRSIKWNIVHLLVKLEVVVFVLTQDNC